MGDASLEERGVWELVYVGGGCRTLRPRMVGGGGAGGAAEWDSGILWPGLSEGSFLPGADTSTLCYPLPPRAPRGPPAGIEDTLSSSSTGLWTGSCIRRLFLVGKDPSVSPAAWAPPGGPQAPPWFWPPPFWTWLQIMGCKPAGTDGCRLEGQAAPQGGQSTKGQPWACSWCVGLRCGKQKPRTGPCRKMRSGRLEQVQRSFSQVSPCLSVHLISAHSSPKQGSDLLQNWNQSCRPDRCPASLGLHASSDRALTTSAMGKLLYDKWRSFSLELRSLVLLLPLILPLCLVRGYCSDLNMALLSPTYTEHPLCARCCLSHLGDNGILAERRA